MILIKPQFEAGRENIGKNGLVLSQKVHCRVLAEMTALFQKLSLAVQLLCPSPIQGGSGNVEYLAAVEKGAAETVLPDIAELAATAFAAAKKEKTG